MSGESQSGSRSDQRGPGARVGLKLGLRALL